MDKWAVVYYEGYIDTPAVWLRNTEEEAIIKCIAVYREHIADESRHPFPPDADLKEIYAKIQDSVCLDFSNQLAVVQVKDT